MNGAQWVVHALRTQGVDTVFGYPGGAIMPVYDALYDGGVEHLLCRHEQGAAMAAIGYARATGKTGVCIATSGPGATNLITGLADALLDSIPIVAITGQVAAPFIGTDAFQEVDVLGLSLACTKHSFLVQSLDELPRVIAEAFQVANSGRPGPVLVDIPKDIQMAQGDLDPHFSTVADEMAFPQAEVAQALQMLAQSQQPMLYVGGGVGMAQAVPALREFLAVTRMPATCTLKGLGVVDADYPYYLGMLGMHGTKAANLAVQECDLLIAVGARFDDRVTGKLEYLRTACQSDPHGHRSGGAEQAASGAYRSDRRSELPAAGAAAAVQLSMAGASGVPHCVPSMPGVTIIPVRQSTRRCC